MLLAMAFDSITVEAAQRRGITACVDVSFETPAPHIISAVLLDKVSAPARRAFVGCSIGHHRRKSLAGVRCLLRCRSRAHAASSFERVGIGESSGYLRRILPGRMASNDPSPGALLDETTGTI